VSAAPAWTAAALLGVAIVLASGRLGGSAPSAPARDAAWQDMSSPQAARGDASNAEAGCPDKPAAPKPAHNGA
jgi:hypothetical protein